MFEKNYKKLRFSQKIGDKSLVECMKVIESNRNYVLSNMRDKTIFCHQGCNLCCHFLNLMIDPLNSYILLRIFQTIPYNELFPYYKKCVENRIKAQEYIDSLPDDVNNNYLIDTYNQLGFTTQSCPFVDSQNGCIIHEFNPQTCFTYFSSVPCKISLNPKMNEGQMVNHEKFKNMFKNRAGSIITSGLDNDCKNYLFDDDVLGTYKKFDNIEKIMKQDSNLEYILSHTIMYEMLTILSLALEMQNQEKYKSDIKDLKVDLLAYIDGEIKCL
jgi:Fe-S-cluster containining protein